MITMADLKNKKCCELIIGFKLKNSKISEIDKIEFKRIGDPMDILFEYPKGIEVLKEELMKVLKELSITLISK